MSYSENYPDPTDIVLNEDQAVIGYAFLAGTSTAKVLADELVAVGAMRGAIMASREGITTEDLKNEAPELFEYRIPASEAVGMKFGFSLAAEGHDASNSGLLKAYTAQDIHEIAKAALTDIAPLNPEVSLGIALQVAKPQQQLPGRAV